MSARPSKPAAFQVWVDEPSDTSVPQPNAIPQKTVAPLPAASSSSAALCRCGKALKHKESCDTKAIVQGFFKRRAEKTPQPECGCSADDGLCGTHASIEIVEIEVLSCLAEAEIATGTQRQAKLHLAMARNLLKASGSAIDGAVKEFIDFLASVGRITATQVKVVLEQATAGHGGGGGSLSYDKETGFGGRPGFDKVLVQKMTVKAGQHRRHIIPWHHIRGFVNACLKEPDLTSVVRDALEGIKHNAEMKDMLARAETNSLAAEAQDWAKALILMNSCRANLWPGSGSQNISINSNYFAISKAIKAWKGKGNRALMAEQLKQWSQATDGKQNRNMIVDRARLFLKPTPLGEANPNMSKSSKVTVDTLDSISSSKADEHIALFVALQADIDEFAHKWALTPLAFDVPATDTSGKVIAAVAIVDRVAREGEKPTAEDAKVVLDALLQPPNWA